MGERRELGCLENVLNFHLFSLIPERKLLSYAIRAGWLRYGEYLLGWLGNGDRVRVILNLQSTITVTI